MFEEEVNEHLVPGLHCKACDKPLSSKDIDPELCGDCMYHVMEYNKDITEIDDAPPTAEEVPN